MKKLLAMLVALLCILAVASAEDLSTLSLEELTAKRQALIEELTQVNAVRGNLIRQQELSSSADDEVLGKIADLFPDEEFAKVIRDECAKFSIEQTVTQADLDKVTRPNLYSPDIHSFAGIGLLRNLKAFDVGMSYDGPFPEEIRSCKELTYISIMFNRHVTEVPEWIGELRNLETLILYDTNIAHIPDSICDLTSLKNLSLSGNSSLTALPENIGNCISLKELNIANTAISELPASIWNLEMSSLNMAGTSIK